MIIVGDKVYRNIQEQVEKNKEDIEDLNHRIPAEPHFYTEEETDELLALKADKSTTYTKEECDNRFLEEPTWHMYAACSLSIEGESGNSSQTEFILLSTYDSVHDIWLNVNNDFWIENEDNDSHINYDKYLIISSNHIFTYDDDSEICSSYIFSDLKAPLTFEDYFNISFMSIYSDTSSKVSTTVTIQLIKIF